MSSLPWLSIVGLNEDGLDGLSDASRSAIEDADIIFGGDRHLLLVGAGEKGRAWSVPFSIEPVLQCKGKKTVVLASGDPFWYGAGGSLVKWLKADEWVSFPVPGVFSLAASALGWRLEETICIGLHATSLEAMRPVLSDGLQVLCTVRDGRAVADLAEYLNSLGFGRSCLNVLESMGGPNQRIRSSCADDYNLSDVEHPVVVAIAVVGFSGLQKSSGLPDDFFIQDGQITKRPIRAITMSTLAPKANETLWDIGSGSGSISVEWCLAARGAQAIAIESRAERIAMIKQNIEAFGLQRLLRVVEGRAPAVLADISTPDVVFIGGGADHSLLKYLWDNLPAGTRLVANSVTLETEALFTDWHATKGGQLMRFEVSEASPLGSMRGWERARPVVQWSVVL